MAVDALVEGLRTGRGVSIPLGCSPVGVLAALTWMDVMNILILLDMERPAGFAEMGMEYGGCASLVLSRMTHEPSLSYLGAELNDKIVPSVQGEVARWAPRARIWKGDFLTEEFGLLLSSFVAHLEGKAVLFCDGFHKPAEMDHFAPFLRSGDLLLAHDYTPEVEGADTVSRASALATCGKHGLEWAVPAHWPDGGLVLLRKP